MATSQRKKTEKQKENKFVNLNTFLFEQDKLSTITNTNIYTFNLIIAVEIL